jgi:hypothetical protein
MKAKLIRESLNEVISFERGKDTLSTLGIGRKNFIEKWLFNLKIIDSVIINKQYEIDGKVGYDIDIRSRKIKEFPEYIKFNIINGHFNCSHNYLTSLSGCPRHVSDYFACINNQLTSLEGCPKFIGGKFYCYNNKIIFTEEYIRSLCFVSGKIENIENI